VVTRSARYLCLVAAVAACQRPKAAATASRPASAADQLTLFDLVGGWRWLHRADESGTSRIEDEQWRLGPDPSAPNRLVGRYVRTVEVRSTDRVPFACNQRPYYRQRAVYDVIAELAPEGLVVRETGYQAELTPCDHGFRHVVDYRAHPAGNRLVLRWDGGEQTLWQIDGELAALPEPPWQDPPDPYGPWRWQASYLDDEGHLREEIEWWEITRRTATRIDATYRRRVTVRSVDGSPIACAGAPTWSFDDAYVLDSQREEEHWHFYERGVEPGDHPCLRPTPRRTLDEATAEQLGDYLVLEWRGKRRQVLYRAE
jgi:hypothetical protein